ncbi:MAG: hypothetical protein ACR2O6_03560 [Ilumatobacteraceae bacterium]
MFAVLGLSDDDGVTLQAMGTDEATFVATYGRKRIETPLSNIDHTEVTGDHRWYTAVGVRLSFADDGLTFGTNHGAGLCVAFVERIPKVIGFRDHSALWVSVAEPDALAEALGV